MSRIVDGLKAGQSAFSDVYTQFRDNRCCGLGSAMAANVVAGIHEDFQHAQRDIGSGFEK